jgi:tripartite-type tricarboxylate transporter receptor subunit TctC
MMSAFRNRLRRAVAILFVACASAPGGAGADDWPTKPITFVVSYAPGGGADLMGRLLAGSMSKILGQSIVVQNRPGGGAGQIGAGFVAHANPDGYTVLIDAGNFAINPGLFPSLPYDPRKDFTVVGVAALYPHVVLVTPSLEANSAADLVRLAKASELSFASSGTGSSQHIAGALFMQSTGVRMTHVPYRGGGPAMVDVMSGHVPVFFGNVASSLPQIQSGKLKALGVAGAKRIAAIPSVPTLDEQGIKGVEIYEWNGMFVPAGTPAAIVDRLADAMQKAMQSEEVRSRVEALGGEPFRGGRQEAAKFVATETQRMTEIIRRNNITLSD